MLRYATLCYAMLCNDTNTTTTNNNNNNNNNAINCIHNTNTTNTTNATNATDANTEVNGAPVQELQPRDVLCSLRTRPVRCI